MGILGSLGESKAVVEGYAFRFLYGFLDELGFQG